MNKKFLVKIFLLFILVFIISCSQKEKAYRELAAMAKVAIVDLQEVERKMSPNVLDIQKRIAGKTDFTEKENRYKEALQKVREKAIAQMDSLIEAKGKDFQISVKQKAKKDQFSLVRLRVEEVYWSGKSFRIAFEGKIRTKQEISEDEIVKIDFVDKNGKIIKTLGFQSRTGRVATGQEENFVAKGLEVSELPKVKRAVIE